MAGMGFFMNLNATNATLFDWDGITAQVFWSRLAHPFLEQAA
jgi:hypothetical protein